jgi:cytochrome c1
MIVALVLGLTKSRMTTGYWIVMVFAILLTLAKYAIKH